MTKLETRLAKVQERYALATSAAKVGVWDWNIDTGDFYLDPNIKAFLGYADHEIPNDLEKWTEYIHPDDKEPVMKAAQDTIEGRHAEYQFEHRMLHKDGGIRWIKVRGSVIRDSHGRPQRFLGTDTDITERRALEQRVSALAGDLQTRVGHDLYNVLAHELAGLTFLLRNLENRLAEEGLPHKREFERLYGVMDDAIHRTRDLALGLSPVLKGCSGLAESLKSLATHSERAYRIECKTSVDYGIRLVDEARANQLYWIAQDAVALLAEQASARRIDIAVSNGGGWLTLNVQGQGEGLAEFVVEQNNPSLQVMDYRVRGLGGNLDIVSRSEGGALVTCACPWD